MTTDLIKVQPGPDHFHKDNQVVCERCMSRLVSSGNLLIDTLAEQSYLFCRFTEFCFIETKMLLLMFFMSAQKTLKEMDLGECIYLATQALRIVLEPLAILIYATTILVIAMCKPNSIKKSPEELKEEKRHKLFNEYKDRNFNAHKLHTDADRTPAPDKRRKYREMAREEEKLAKEALHKYWKT